MALYEILCIYLAYNFSDIPEMCFSAVLFLCFIVTLCNKNNAKIRWVLFTAYALVIVAYIINSIVYVKEQNGVDKVIDTICKVNIAFKILPRCEE